MMLPSGRINFNLYKPAHCTSLMFISVAMYVYISSSDCHPLYPDNTSTHFTIELPVAIHTESYEVALTQIYFKGETFCILKADICEESIVNCSLQPVVATFYKSGDIARPAYKNIVRDWIKRIHFSLESSEKIGEFYFTLHFKELVFHKREI